MSLSSLRDAVGEEQNRIRSYLTEVRGAIYEPIIQRYLARTVLLSLSFGAILAILNPPVVEGDVRAVLTTLATAEASVLAIVYSVTVVAFQLVTTRYSSRLTSLFIEAPLYRVTFALFVVSIATNLVFVYLFEAGSAVLLNAEIGVAFGLALVSTIALYQFIRSIIERSTPEALIDSIVERELNPEEYIPKFHSDTNYFRTHPLHPLNSTATQAFDREEYETVLQAVMALDEVLNSSIQYISNTFDHDEGTEELIAEISERPLSEYYPVLAIKLEQAAQEEIYTEIIDSAGRVAKTGLESGYSDVAGFATDGLADIHDEAPRSWEGTRIRREATNIGVDIVEKTARESDYPTFKRTLHNVNNPIIIALRRKIEQQSLDFYLLTYYSSHQINILNVLLERYCGEIDVAAVDWLETDLGRGNDGFQSLREIWRERVKLTRAMLFYKQSTGEFPIAEGSMLDGWNTAIEDSLEAGLPGLGCLFCVSMIETMYALEKLHGEDPTHGVNSLANIRKDHSEEVVDDAFERLKTNASATRERIPRFESIEDEESNGLIDKFTQDSGSFTSWVKTRHAEVQERTDYLRQNYGDDS